MSFVVFYFVAKNFVWDDKNYPQKGNNSINDKTISFGGSTYFYEKNCSWEISSKGQEAKLNGVGKTEPYSVCLSN